MEGIVNLVNRIPFQKNKAKELENQKKEDLFNRLHETSTRLNALRNAFESETNFELIDAYIFEIDALERQYSFLIKTAKEQHLVAN